MVERQEKGQEISWKVELLETGTLPRTVRTIGVNRREVLKGALRVSLHRLGALLPVSRADLAMLLLRGL